MHRILGLLLLVVLAAKSVFGTAQIPDVISYDGKEYDLQTNPMEPYFKQHPEKKPKSEIMSTALWRGYVATFEVKDKRLLLKDIEVRVPTKGADGQEDYGFTSARTNLVPDGTELAVDWFSGILVLPFGERVQYVHMGYGSTYSNYILLEVKDGRITGERRLDVEQYKQFRERQFQAFKKTDAYKKQVTELQGNGQPTEFIDSFLRDFVVDYTSEFLDGEPSATRPAEAR